VASVGIGRKIDPDAYVSLIEAEFQNVIHPDAIKYRLDPLTFSAELLFKLEFDCLYIKNV